MSKKTEHDKIQLYGLVYEEYTKKNIQTEVPKVKKLNKYQEFVKIESKKDEYKKFSPKNRLAEIAKKWKKNN